MDVVLILKSYIFSMLYWAVELYSWIVIAYIVAGWLVSNRGATWYVFLEELVEPVLLRLRTMTGNRLTFERFDLSPLLLFVAIRLVQKLLAYIFL